MLMKNVQNKKTTVFIIKRLIFYVGQISRMLHTYYLRLAGVKIGNNCMISLRAKFDITRGKIIIGNNCTITYGCILCSHDASARHIDINDTGEGIVLIEDHVHIGVNSVILRNVRIGKNSVIGAGSVVTRDIPSNCVAVGNPCTVIRKISRFEEND